MQTRTLGIRFSVLVLHREDTLGTESKHIHFNRIFRSP